VFTFAVMLVIALLVSTLTAHVREQSEAAQVRERRTESLYQLSRRLSATTGRQQIVDAAAEHIAAILQVETAILLPDEDGQLRFGPRSSPALKADASVLEAARRVHEHGRLAGAGAAAHSDASFLCLPLSSPDGIAGVVAVRSADPEACLSPERRRLLETIAAQVAMAIERDRLTERMHRALAQAEAEKLRSTLLSSVSHDFRTPLAVIAGASSSLIEAGGDLGEEARQELLQTIFDESDRLTRLVENLLHITRIESGQFPMKTEWHVVEDLVGSALTRLARRLSRHAVTTSLPDDLPLVLVDGVLIEQVLINLLDNAAKYSPEGSAIEVSAGFRGDRLVIEVADRGPGLPLEDKGRVFEKFYRGRQGSGAGVGGAGLGLAICQAVAALHRGSVRVEDRPGGGSRFCLAVPVEKQPPAIDGERHAAGVG
jgi:two-component system sensor histidine kinase KdpD